MGAPYEQTVFFAMPFRTKTVGNREVNFDAVYREVFVPAITSARTPAGLALIPKRADSDAYSANIDIEMYNFLEFSRLVVADITGLNANVLYELGVRHRSRPSGTLIIKEASAPLPGHPAERLPFDLGRIRVFDYAHEPADRIPESIGFLTQLISNSIAANAVDSPPCAALQDAVRDDPAVAQKMAAAENALRMCDPPKAMALYKELLQATRHRSSAFRSELRAKIALLSRDLGRWHDARDYAAQAVDEEPENAGAWRDLGIAQGRLWAAAPAEERPHLPTGEQALSKAVALAPDDYDAWSSLGGALRRKALETSDEAARTALLREALSAYDRGRRASGDHPYPTLNAFKLRIELGDSPVPTAAQRIALTRASTIRKVQADAEPPYDAPWSCFDMADIALFLGRDDEFASYLNRGALNARPEEIEAELKTLRMLRARLCAREALHAGIAFLEEVKNA